MRKGLGKMLKSISKLRKAAMGLSFLLFFTAAAPISGLVDKAHSCIWPFRRKQQTQEETLKKELKKGARIDIKFIEKIQRTKQHHLYFEFWKTLRAKEWDKFREQPTEFYPYPGSEAIFDLEEWQENRMRGAELILIDEYLESKKPSLKKKAEYSLKRHCERILCGYLKPRKTLKSLQEKGEMDLTKRSKKVFKEIFEEIRPGMSETADADISATIKTSVYQHDNLSNIMKIIGKKYARLLCEGSPLQKGSALEQKVLQETAYDMLGNDFSFRYAKEFFRDDTYASYTSRRNRYLNDLFDIEDTDKTALEMEFGKKIKGYDTKFARKKLSYLIRELGPYFFIDTTKYLTNLNELDYTYNLAKETSDLNGIELKQRSIENQEKIKGLLKKGVSNWGLRKELVKESLLQHELYDRLPQIKGILDPITDIFKKNNEKGVNQ